MVGQEVITRAFFAEDKATCLDEVAEKVLFRAKSPQCHCEGRSPEAISK
ncbi:MAG: hypothetical protein V3T89_00095 [bacterium]